MYWCCSSRYRCLLRDDEKIVYLVLIPGDVPHHKIFLLKPFPKMIVTPRGVCDLGTVP